MALKNILLIVLLMIAGSYQHGRLMDPVNRGSMWRLGYSTPPDYNDDQGSCGGYGEQYSKQGGKCGECGDAYGMTRPRPHENGGTFGSGIIVKTYTAGSTIKTVTTLTTNHKGWFYFSICPLANNGDLETEECFAKYPLKLTNGDSYYSLLSSDNGDYEVDLVLPAGLTCDQCVLRWSWTVANNWGTCANGTGAIGCGNQETFRTCSDIAIH